VLSRMEDAYPVAKRAMIENFMIDDGKLVGECRKCDGEKSEKRRDCGLGDEFSNICGPSSYTRPHPLREAIGQPN
jgi:hypothetical protein